MPEALKFYNHTVKIPAVKGKIFHKKYRGFHYIHYQYANSYNKEKTRLIIDDVIDDVLKT